MIFKQASCEEELYESMEKAQLEAVAKEEQREGELFLEAMQELNAAAECFERAGRTSRAKEVTQVMISLSSAITNIDQILSVIQGWAGGDITAQKSGNTIEVWSWGVPKDQKQVVETNMKNSLESYLQGQGITTTVPIIYQAVSTPSFDTDDNNDKTAKKSSKDEVKKVFMFFGFGPEDLKGLDSSNGDTGDGE